MPKIEWCDKGKIGTGDAATLSGILLSLGFRGL